MNAITDPRAKGVTPREDGPLLNAMSVDVEEHFHVQAFAGHIARADWDARESRVERNVDAILALFAETRTHATFFTLGWVAERHKAMIRRIVDQGHELASHGYAHIRADAQTPAEFRADIARTKAILEDSGGCRVQGYRAATFSIGKRNLWAFEELAGAGYAYSSSIFPIHHDLYGMPGAPRFAFRPQAGIDLVEVPATTAMIAGRTLPCSGGGFFRMLPYGLSRALMRRVNRRDSQPCVFYFHPWEIDPGQPVERRAPLKSRLRHYTNLSVMEDKLKRVLKDFRWDRMDRVFAVGRP